MNVYRYDEKTKEYIGYEQALLDPLETKKQGNNIYLLPANATFTKPPAEKEGYAIVWNGKAWQEVEDHRGVEYWLPEDKYGAPARVMKELGALPEGAMLTPPEQTLDDVKTVKIASLKADRDRLEVEDIEVDGHLYDYDEKARERINNAIIALQASNGSIQWTLADNNSVLVTAQDLIAVVSTVAVRSNALHIAYRDAKAKVNAAMTAEEVNAVALDV